MLHGAIDAAVLHMRAINALGLNVEQEIHVSDAHRPFIITVARHGSLKSPPNVHGFQWGLANTA
jgi:hypothetical protein